MARRTRRHSGGSNRYPNYKYTRNISRSKWTNSLYPYANTILSALSKLQWSEFHYEGPTAFLIDTFLNKNTLDGFTMNKELKQQTKIVSAVLTANPKPYEIFGGAACELYNSAFPQVSIVKFVDPTGDIDIRVSQPFFTFTDPELESYYDETGYLEIAMIQDGTYTECGNAFTQWIFKEVIKQMTPIAGQFIRKEFSLPRVEEDEETKLADLQENVGNFLITRCITDNKEMIKIQVTIKVEDSVNHLAEFIISHKGFKPSNNNILIKDLYVQQPRTVLLSQLDALVSRGEGVMQLNNTSETVLNFYKIENHCGRILYLIYLLKQIGLTRYKNVSINTLSLSDAILILKQLYRNNIFMLCSKHFGETYIDQIIQVLESFSSIGKGALTTLLNPVYKKELNKAKGLLGGRKTRCHSLKGRVSCKSKSTVK